MSSDPKHSSVKKNELDGEKQPMVDDQSQLQAEIDKLHQELEQAKENEMRALADYRNVVRRSQEDRIRTVKLAAQDIVQAILQPLEHLYLAKEQLKDPGLNMVYQQFQQALQQEGLEEIECLGKEFDERVMEVVDKQKVEDEKQIGKVVKVTSRGYLLNGEVIRHAKVVIGE